MNVIHFSPHFPENYRFFTKALKALNITVLGIGDLVYEKLHPETKESLTEYYKVADMNNYEEVFRAVAFLSYKYGKIDNLDSFNEYWLEMEAKLRTDFNISGVDSRKIDKIKQKSEMKKVFEEAGIAVARGRVIDAIDAAFHFVAEVGYPIVAKPNTGVGAVNTYKIGNDTELKNFFSKKIETPYIFEEFVVGTIYSFDGLTDNEGNIVFYTGHVYQDGVMEVVNDDKHIYYYSLREIPAELEREGRKVISAFDVKKRFFHVEFFKTAGDKFVALEVNMRPPGGFTTDMFNYANDIDVYKIWAETISETVSEVIYARNYHCCYVGRKNSKKYLYGDEEIKAKYGSFIVHQSEVSGVFSAALGDYCYIIRGKNLAKIMEITGYIQTITNN